MINHEIQKELLKKGLPSNYMHIVKREFNQYRVYSEGIELYSMNVNTKIYEKRYTDTYIHQEIRILEQDEKKEKKERDILKRHKNIPKYARETNEGKLKSIQHEISRYKDIEKIYEEKEENIKSILKGIGYKYKEKIGV